MIDRTVMSLAVALVISILPASTRAQGPGSKDSPKAPAAPLSIVEARAFLAQRDWAHAAEAYREVLKSNPHDGEHWFNFGMCLYSLKRYDEATKPFEKAADLGFRPEVATYNIACCLALSGHKDEAIARVEKAIETGFNQDGLLHSDSDLDSLRNDARFKKLLGAAPRACRAEAMGLRPRLSRPPHGEGALQPVRQGIAGEVSDCGE